MFERYRQFLESVTASEKKSRDVTKLSSFDFHRNKKTGQLPQIPCYRVRMFQGIWPFNKLRKLDEFWFFKLTAKLESQPFEPDERFREHLTYVEEVLGTLRGPACLTTFLKWMVPVALFGFLAGYSHRLELLGLVLAVAVLPAVYAHLRARWKQK